uniref:Calcyclin-binding protein n=1 Tax=Rhabditophanes sp. KR3021 TaxID=114890 RepID=A0AC35U9I2_9BILA
MSAFPKFEWYQTEKQVTISINKADVDIKNARADLNSGNKLSVFVGDKIIFDSTLTHAIDGNKITLTCTRKKLEVKCLKIDILSWTKLVIELENKKVIQIEPVRSNNTKNWAKIGKEAEKEEDNEDGIYKHVKELYSNSDDATKKAMLKSFTESNGTALSTDWNKVKRVQKPE